MAASQVQVRDGYSVRSLSNTSRVVTTHDKGYVLVSYSTPVAVYDRETDVLCKTQVRWSNTTSRHIRDFELTYRPGKVETVPQSYIDDKMRAITGRSSLN